MGEKFRCGKLHLILDSYLTGHYQIYVDVQFLNGCNLLRINKAIISSAVS